MLIETTTRMMALLVWDRVIPSFSFAGALPLTNFTADPAVLNSSITVAKQLIAGAMTVGHKCMKMTYVNPSLNITAAYRATPDWSAVHIIVLPTNWNIQTVSADLNYVIANDTLHVYDQNQFTYVSKYSFANPQGNNYEIRSLGGRVVVWTRKTNGVDYTSTLGFWILMSEIYVYTFHNQTSGFTLIGKSNNITHVEQSLNGQSSFSVFTSPQLTKLGLGYFDPAVNITQVIAKNVNYNTNKWYDLKFSNPMHYLTTIQRIDPLRELDFNDFYLVVRNATMATNYSDPNQTPYEEVYQMVSNNFTLLRARNLALDNTTVPPMNLPREFTTFIKTFIDPSVTTKALVLDVYLVTNTSYQIVQWDYGSLLSNRQVVKESPPSYIDFLQPQYYDMVSTSAMYQWAFFTSNGANTDLIVYSIDNGTNSHFRVNTYPLNGPNWSLVYKNKNCKILREHGGTGAITVNHELPNGTYITLTDLSTVSNLTVTNSSVWQMADDCSRFRVDDKFYYHIAGSGGNFGEFLVPANFTVDQVDANVTHATSTAGDLWKFDVPSGMLKRVLTPPVAFPSGATLLTAGNIVGLGKTTPTSAWFLGLQMQVDGTYQKCINYSEKAFIEQPILETSPLLTKILLVGKATHPIHNNTFVRTDFYFMNCPTFQNISLPNTYMQNPAKIRIDVGEDAVHLVQLDNSTNAPIKDVVYYLDQNTVAIMAFDQPITLPANTVWIRSQTYLSDFGDTFLLSEFVWTDPNNSSAKHRVINVTEVNGKQAIFNNKYNGSFTAQVVNG